MSDSVESPTLRLIRELLDSAPRVPLTNQARVEPGPLLDLFDRLRPELEGAEPQLDALRQRVETASQVPLAQDRPASIPAAARERAEGVSRGSPGVR